MNKILKEGSVIISISDLDKLRDIEMKYNDLVESLDSKSKVLYSIDIYRKQELCGIFTTVIDKFFFFDGQNKVKEKIKILDRCIDNENKKTETLKKDYNNEITRLKKKLEQKDLKEKSLLTKIINLFKRK